MPRNIARANAAKSSIRAHVEYVFAHQKNRFGLFIRTIGIARAEAKLILANIAYNFDRLIFHERVGTLGWIRLPSENWPTSVSAKRSDAQIRPINRLPTPNPAENPAAGSICRS